MKVTIACASAALLTPCAALSAIVKLAAPELPAECRLDPGEYKGSIHAAVLYDNGGGMPGEPRGTPAGPAKQKEQQTVICQGEPGAVLWFDFGKREHAVAALPLLGARLWGKNGPTYVRSEELLISGGLVAVVTSKAPWPLVQLLVEKRAMQRYLPPPPDLDASDLASMRDTLRCDTTDGRWARYCAALDSFASSRPLQLKERALAGTSLFMGDKPVEEASYLTMSDTGAMYGTVKPTNDQERDQVREFLQIAARGETPPASDPIVSYVRTLSGPRGHLVVTTGGSSTWREELRTFARESEKGITVIELGNIAVGDCPSACRRTFAIGVFRRK